MLRSTRLGLLTMGFVVGLAGSAFAQGQIAGTVKDATGALLPGVTVEASSPALIEKVRTVVTDGSGQYRIVDLRPGTYAVTFTLPGFNTFKRDGIELTGHFTATVDAEMKLGAVEETITVTGQAPVVDVQSASLQRVISKDIIDAIPAGRGQSALAVLIPGMTAGGQDVGGTNNQSLSRHLDPWRPWHRPAPERGRADGAQRGRPGQLDQHRHGRRVQPGNDHRLRRRQRRGRHGRRALQLRAQGRRQPVLGLVLRQPDQFQTSRTATTRPSWPHRASGRRTA